MSLRRRLATMSRCSWVLSVVAVAVLCLGTTALFYRFHYGTWPTAQYPSTLHYCGHSYDQDQPAVSRSAAASLASEIARPAGYSGSTLYPAFDYSAPFVDPYHVFAGQPRTVHVGDTPTCTMKLYLQTGPDLYLSYSLDGSPG